MIFGFDRHEIDVRTTIKRTTIMTSIESKGWSVRKDICARRGRLVELAKGAKATEGYHDRPALRRTVRTILCTHVKELRLASWSFQYWRRSVYSFEWILYSTFSHGPQHVLTNFFDSLHNLPVAYPWP